MVIYLPANKSKGHIQHCMALKEYFSLYGKAYFYEGMSIPFFKRVFSEKIVFVQTIDFLNPLLFLFLRLIRVSVIYYLHEPGGLKEKIDKGDSLFYSIFVYAVQIMEVLLSNVVMIGRNRDTNELISKYGAFVSKFKYCPLLYLPCVHLKNKKRKYDIIYVGRLDKRRSIREFVDIVGFKKAVLTSGVFEYYDNDINVYDKVPFSEEQKEDLMLGAKCSWNIYSVPYNQSGNTVDALRYGCYPIISEFDPYANKLRTYGCVVDNFNHINDFVFALTDSWDENTAIKLKELFTELGGWKAFNMYWLPVFKSLKIL